MEIVESRTEVFRRADILLFVRALGANPDHGKNDIRHFRKNQVIIGLLEPYGADGEIKQLAQNGVVAFALELLPRVTRAQGMDALSSMSAISGCKAALLAADSLPRMFPMLMTAAGTVAPARVFVIGANDMVNPVTRTDPHGPIAGMPIIDVDKARLAVVIKRSLSP